MSNTEQKRSMIMDAYPLSTGWKARVKRMTEQQVIAVYLRLERTGRITKPL